MIKLQKKCYGGGGGGQPLPPKRPKYGIRSGRVSLGLQLGIVIKILSSYHVKNGKRLFRKNDNFLNILSKFLDPRWHAMACYGNSLFDITEKYIVIAKYLIKYMIYVWRLH